MALTITTRRPISGWMDRIQYFNSNYVIIQRNYAAEEPGRINWPKWKTFMNGSIYANDPAGGMVKTKPLFIA